MKTNFYYVTLFFMLCSVGLFAQKDRQKASLFGKAEYVRNVPALSKMDNIISAKGMIKHGQEKRKGKNTYIPGKGLPAEGQPDPLMQVQQKSSRTAISTEVANFQSHEGFSTPTDPTGAIGPNHYVYAFNSGFGILDRSGNVLLAEASLATIFPGENLGDPIVLYDNFAERFVIMQFSNSPNGVLIAVGQGPDPVNDGWFTYRFNTGTFPDYEKISIWNNGYYITANKDSNTADTSEVVYAVERDLMLVGDPNAQFVGFPLPGIETNGFYSPGGTHVTGPTLPPAGAEHSVIYLQDDAWAGITQDHIKVWTTSVDWTDITNSTISQPQEVITAPFDSVFDGGSFSNLTQPSGPDIDALQATMMYMTTYRRFATHNSMILNFVVDLDGSDDLSGIRWYEMRQTADGQPWTIFQEGTYVQPDGLSAFCGSMAMDAQGNIGLAYSVVSPTTFPSIRYTGRLASDPIGTMTLAEQVAVNGTQIDPSFRYGDYGHMTIDPTDDMTFWHTAEYFDAGFRKNHVVAFSLQPDVIDEEAPTAPTNLVASNTTARETTLDWDASTDNIGVTGYNIFQDGVLVATVPGITAVVNGLDPLTTYDFFVVAVDASGNESPASNTVTITTLESTIGPGCLNGLVAPYAESYESGLGNWTQDTGDDLDWIINSNGTPSNSTGPSSAIDGTSYVYVEASGNGTGFPDKTAILNSPCFDLNDVTAASFSFQFHMFGSDDFGSLSLEASSDEGVTWTSVWNRTGNQGDSWQTATVDLSAFVGFGAQLRFVRVTGTTWRADAAIDDLQLTTSSEPDGGTCVSGDITLSITFDNFPQETSWTLTNSSGTVVASDSYSAANPDGSTVTETFAGLANDNYTFTIFDSSNDGICCQSGNGSYTLSSAAGTIVTGGDFTDQVATDFCVEGSDDDGSGDDDCISDDITLSITLDNFPEETSWTLTNSGGTVVASETYSTANPDGSTVTETFAGLADDTYIFTIFDAFGDGICCGFGNGSYTLSSASAGVIVSGGEFGGQEATEFCVEGSDGDDDDDGSGDDSCITGDVNLSITLDNFPEETSWTLANSGGTVVASETYSTANPDGSTVTETFAGLANDTYTFTIFDAFGDGICCGFGNGSYTLSSAAGVIITGGDFGGSESTNFCIQGSSALQTFPLSGLRSEDTDAFKVYPVPTTGILNVTVGDRSIDNVKIFSMFGQLVKEITNQGTNSQIDVNNLSIGTYFVRFTSNKEGLEITRKFVIAE